MNKNNQNGKCSKDNQTDQNNKNSQDNQENQINQNNQINIKNIIQKNNQKILQYRKFIIELEKQNDILIKKCENLQKVKFNLNKQQKLAVEGTKSNSIIIACPGSGKTHTLIAKIIFLIKTKNVDPSKIILVIFTKKASQEMNNRLYKQINWKNFLT